MKQIIKDNDDLWYSDDNLWSNDDILFESQVKNDNLIHKVKSTKQQFLNKKRKETFNNVVNILPDVNEYYHIVSNGEYDFFSMIEVIARLMTSCDDFYGSTWTMSYNNVVDLENMYKDKLLNNINILTGTYFKKRSTPVFNKLVDFTLKYNHRLITFENHTKILLMNNIKYNFYIVVEGSANFTMNPRTEQFTMTNNKSLFDFHRNWMDYIFKYSKQNTSKLK